MAGPTRRRIVVPAPCSVFHLPELKLISHWPVLGGSEHLKLSTGRASQSEMALGWVGLARRPGGLFSVLCCVTGHSLGTSPALCCPPYPEPGIPDPTSVSNLTSMWVRSHAEQ